LLFIDINSPLYTLGFKVHKIQAIPLSLKTTPTDRKYVRLSMEFMQMCASKDYRRSMECLQTCPRRTTTQIEQPCQRRTTATSEHHSQKVFSIKLIK
jgi:hypothetical protein